MTKLALHQAVALAGTKKARAQSELTKAHHMSQKEDLLKGIARSYRPKDDDGEKLPDERQGVTYTATQAVKDITGPLAEMFDIVATIDDGNRVAQADVVVDGVTVVKSASVPTLIFLEKQLVDLKTFVDKLPTLNPVHQWTWDPATMVYRATPIETNRTKKVWRNHVKSEATKEHPAQVEVFSEDIPVGTWVTTHFSGAIQASTKQEWLDKIRKLHDAVVTARETANRQEVEMKSIGADVLGFVFGSNSAS